MSDLSSATKTGFAIPMPSRHQALMLAGVTVAAAGAALNWGWLTAIGVAPLLLSLAPCAAMCALGLCMRGDSAGCAKSDPAAVPGATND